MRAGRGKSGSVFHRLRSDGAKVIALTVLILFFATVVLVTVVRTSWDELPKPEIIVETCSFLVALLIVLAQQGAERRARRQRAIETVIRELSANASELTSGELMRTGPQLLEAMADLDDGLRYYYSHLATTATRGSILSGALAGREDRELLRRLSQWVHDCEACNRRFTMSELRLFSTEGDESGVRERARIHVSIVTGPATQQRKALKEIADFVILLQDDSDLPKQMSPLVDELAAAVDRFSAADAVAEELEQEILQRQFGFVA